MVDKATTAYAANTALANEFSNESCATRGMNAQAGESGTYSYADGRWYSNEKREVANSDLAVRSAMLAAEAGDPEAMIDLGRWYSMLGRSVASYCDRALDYFIGAAQKGLAIGYLLAGKVYEFCGNNEWAARCYMEAAEHGVDTGKAALDQILLAHPMLRLKLA